MHFPPKFLQKRFPPTFSMVHLLHRLYGVDVPGHTICCLRDFALLPTSALKFWQIKFNIKLSHNSIFTVTQSKHPFRPTKHFFTAASKMLTIKH